MTARIGVLILIATLSLTGSWLLGYHEGQKTGAFRLLHEMGADSATVSARSESNGIEKGRDQVCGEIRRYKFSMAKELDENTQICGWPDMDGPEESNSSSRSE
jgi:hypothetical protein